MSSSKLFPYKMRKDQWIEADALTDSDIAVIIDINSKIFWFWEGSLSTARDRYNARQILGQLRKKYTTYKFKRINKGASEDVRDKLEMLQIHALAKKKSDKRGNIKNLSNYFYSLSIINGTFTFFIIILLNNVFLLSQSVFPDISINQDNFIFTLGISSFLSFISFILLIISAIFLGISRKSLLMIISIIGCCLIFIPFFMLRIWDVLLIVNPSGQQFLVQIDAIFFYMFSIDLFLALSLTCCFLVGIMGFMNISILRNKEKEI